MMHSRRIQGRLRFGFSVALAATMVAGALAQDLAQPKPEPKQSPSIANTAAVATGAVRLARFSFVQGKVSWRPDASTEWADATDNVPIRQGAEISVSDDAKAEIQFDDGSTLRLAPGSDLSLDYLYSDADGEFTELKLTAGTASLHLRTKLSIYQVDAPEGDVKAAGPAKLRLDATSHLKVAVQEGDATMDTPAGTFKLKEGDFSQVLNDKDAPQVLDLPDSDDWDAFCNSRDTETSVADEHLPPEMALVAGDMDNYGDWQNDPQYGQVWSPRDQDDSWRPYQDGNWNWVEPFGWTWVSAEPWGWAPYHYGTWIRVRHRWAWVPGPGHQCWSPALVSFTFTNGFITWVPLAPCEVHYTTVSFGFGHGDWAMFFSIGGCGSYFAQGPDYCVAKPWNNRYLNHDSFLHPVASEERERIATTVNREFRPHNALSDGATRTSVDDFGRNRRFVKVGRTAMISFEKGKSIRAVGAQPISGPGNIRPSVSHVAMGHVSPQVGQVRSVDRAVFRGPVQASTQLRDRVVSVARNSVTTGPVEFPRTFSAQSGVTTRSPALLAARARASLGYVGAGANHIVVGSEIEPRRRSSSGGGQYGASRYQGSENTERSGGTTSSNSGRWSTQFRNNSETRGQGQQTSGSWGNSSRNQEPRGNLQQGRSEQNQQGGEVQRVPEERRQASGQEPRRQEPVHQNPSKDDGKHKG